MQQYNEVDESKEICCIGNAATRLRGKRLKLAHTNTLLLIYYQRVRFVKYPLVLANLPSVFASTLPPIAEF